MANHYSALKRVRQTEKRTAANRNSKSRLRTAIRNLRQALASGDAKSAEQQYRATESAIDKAIQKGVIHHNTANRYKGRLAQRVAKVGK